MAARKQRESGPLEQLAQLASALAAPAALPRALLVRGEERHFREEALKLIGEAARARGLELVRHDGSDPDFSLSTLLSDLSSAPMFSAARCVLVRGAAPLLKKEESRAAPLASAALAFLAGDSVPGMLVLEAEGLRADHAVAKAIAASGAPALDLRRLYDSPPPWNPDPRQTELIGWLLARARARGIALSSEDAIYIQAATGNDLGALEGQLARIAARGAASVRSAVTWNGGAVPFEVAEHLLRGDLAQAMDGLERMFRGGFQERDGSRQLDEAAILNIFFNALRSKLRVTLAAARAQERGLDPVAASGAPSYPKARIELEERLGRRSAREWERMLEAELELERANRSGGSKLGLDDLAAFALRWRVQRERAEKSRR